MDARVITSTRAQVVADARRLHRRHERLKTGRFLIEGPRVVHEALAKHGQTGAVVAELFVTDDAAGRHPDVAREAARLSIPVRRIGAAVAKLLSDTVTPQGVFAVCALQTAALAGLGTDLRLVVVLLDVGDPGNAGTVIRLADAAGADAVVLTGNSVDPHNGKCVRATAGSLFHLPVVVETDPADVCSRLRASGLGVFAADAHATSDLEAAETRALLARPTAWLFGNEAHGLHEAAATLADLAIRVPVYGQAESLNLASAAAVCVYATARAQRGG